MAWNLAAAWCTLKGGEGGVRGEMPHDEAYFWVDSGRRVDLGEGGGDMRRCRAVRPGDEGMLGPGLYFACSFDDSDVKLDCER